MIERITQSFIKDMRSYKAGELCGNIIRERWVNNRLLEDPDREPGAMELGAYFEFITFGTLPKGGKIPQPVYMLTPLKKNGGSPDGLQVEDMTEPYRFAHKQSKHLLAYMDRMGFKILHAGKHLTKGRYEGTLDLIVECTKDIDDFVIGNVIVIDIKYSGLMGPNIPWRNKHGWQWSDVQKKYHGTQALHYHFISDGLKFYFLVTSSTVEGEAKMFYIPIDEFESEQHIMEGNSLFEDLKFFSEVGLEARPSLVTCNKCPLRNECHDRQLWPKVEVVKIVTE